MSKGVGHVHLPGVTFLMISSSSYQARITNQLHRLGGSYDWDRVAFTMDEVRHSAFN
jgi:valyl-tRNA synthetase